jgi:hypothetical protein
MIDQFIDCAHASPAHATNTPIIQSHILSFCPLSAGLWQASLDFAVRLKQKSWRVPVGYGLDGVVIYRNLNP